ncbi:MAG: VCBS repeat-containing protein, partial [Cytophagia bacterium]|nr:VCBS repeat-containing protein [Cytophagia bacterium]
MKSITTRYGNQNISQYSINYRDDTYAYFQKLNYATNEWNGSAATSAANNTPQTAERRSLLSDIKLCAWDESNIKSCLPQTVVNRSIWKAGLKAQNQVLPLADDRMFMGKLLTGDFDGDAKTDYGFARGSYLTSGVGMSVFLSTTQQWSDISDLVNRHSTGKHSVTNLTLDYDLDGQTDFAAAKKNANGEHELSLVRFNGTSFESYDTNINVDCGYEAALAVGRVRSFCQSYTLDYNGDGKTDILALQRSGTRSLTLRLYENTHTGRYSAPYNHQPSFQLVQTFELSTNTTPVVEPLEVTDLDGDGRVELVGVRYLGSYSNSDREAISLEITNTGAMSVTSFASESVTNPVITHPILSKELMVDFNGDGLADIYAYNHQNHTSKMFINTGNGFTEVNTNLTGQLISPKIFDYNQDGLPDVLVRGSGVYGHNCGEAPSEQNQEFMDNWNKCTELNTQYNWSVAQTKLSTNGDINFTFIDESELNIVASPEYLMTVDHNGDGSLDLMVQKGSSQMTGPDASAFYAYENPNANTDAVIRITAGVGKFHQSTTFEYRSLSDLAKVNRYTYGREQNYPYVKFNTATQMLDKMNSDDGQGGVITSKFAYTDARYHVAGRGFQGFATLTQENVNAGTKSVAEFNQTFPFTGKVEKSESWVRDSNGNYQKVAEKDVVWNSMQIRNAYLVYPSVSTELKNSLNNPSQALSSSTTSVESIDSEGYVTQSRTEADSGYGTAKTITTTNYDHAGWVGKVSDVTVDVLPLENRVGVNIDSSTDFKRTVRTSYTDWDYTKRLPKTVRKEFYNAQGQLEAQATEVSTQYNTYGMPLEVSTKDTVSGAIRKVTTNYSNDGQFASADGYFPFTVENDKAQTITTYTNPKYGKPNKAVDTNGQWVESFYDAFARVKKTQSGGLNGQLVSPPSYMRYQWCDGCDGMSSNIVYKVSTYQAGLPVATEYKDKLNRTLVSHTTNPEGEDMYSRTDYDSLGRVTFESIVSGDVYESRGTKYITYDNLGRVLTKIIDQSDDQELVVSYDYQGHETNIVAGDNSMSRTYNGFGQLIKTTDALGG